MKSEPEKKIASLDKILNTIDHLKNDLFEGPDLSELREAIAALTKEEQTQLLRKILLSDKTRTLSGIDTIFTKINKDEILELMILEGLNRKIFNNLRFFGTLDQKMLVRKLIKANQVAAVCEHVHDFSNLDINWFVDELIAHSEFTTLFALKDKFPLLNEEYFIKKLEETNEVSVICSYLHHFPKIDKKWLIEKMIEERATGDFFRHIDAFVDLDPSLFKEYVVKIANDLYHYRPHLIHLVIPCIDMLPEYDAKLYLEFMIGASGWDSDNVCKKIDEIPEKYHLHILYTLISFRKRTHVNNYMRKFTGVNKDTLFNLLVKNGYIVTVLKNIDLFPGFDQELLANNLVSSDGIGILLKNIHLFSSLDKTWILKQIIVAKKIELVIPYLHLFPMMSVDFLLDELINEDKLEAICRNISLFSNIDRDALFDLLSLRNEIKLMILYSSLFTVDKQKKVIMMIETESQAYLIFSKFPDLSIKTQMFFYEQMIQKNLLRPLIDNFLEFQNVDYRLLAQKCVESHYFEGLFNMSLMIPDFALELYVSEIVNSHISFSQAFQLLPYVNILSSRDKSTLISKISNADYEYKYDFDDEDKHDASTEVVEEIVEYRDPKTMQILGSMSDESRIVLAKSNIRHKYYGSLLVLLTEFNYTSEQLGFSYSQARDTVSSLIQAKNYVHASQLIECALILFPNEQNELENLQKIIPRPEIKVEFRERFKELDCTKEIFAYYVSVLLRNNYSFTQLPKQISDEIITPISSLFKKIREYILYAVSSEIRHSKSKRGIARFGSRNEMLYRAGTAEDIRIYFEKAEENFLVEDNFHSASYGGKSWATIAEFGRRIWEDDVYDDLHLQTYLLNIVVSIQHNSGYFFDKDSRRVDLNHDELYDLLEFEASGDHSVLSFLRYGIDKEIISQEEYGDYLELFNMCERIKKEGSTIDTDNFFLRYSSERINQTVSAIVNNANLPEEIRLLTLSAFSEIHGFSRQQVGFSHLGRLLEILKVDWQEDDGIVKKYQNNEHTLFSVSVEGYRLAFWYKNGKLQKINSVREVIQLAPELSKVVKKSIVKAQLNYMGEGD